MAVKSAKQEQLYKLPSTQQPTKQEVGALRRTPRSPAVSREAKNEPPGVRCRSRRNGPEDTAKRELSLKHEEKNGMWEVSKRKRSLESTESLRREIYGAKGWRKASMGGHRESRKVPKPGSGSEKSYDSPRHPWSSRKSKRYSGDRSFG